MIGKAEIKAALEQHEMLANRAIEIHGSPESYLENMDLSVDGIMEASAEYGMDRTSMVGETLTESGFFEAEDDKEKLVALVLTFHPKHVAMWLAACYHEGLIVGMMLARDAWGD